MRYTKQWVLSMLLMACSVLAYAQTATTDLANHEPTVVPAGATFEWRVGDDPTTDALVTTPAAVAPGIYYGFFNFGSGCFSEPSPIRILTNTCPTETVDLNDATDPALNPAGSTLSFHSALPASAANEITGTAVTEAAAGTYYVAFKTSLDDGTGPADCYSEASPIVMAVTTCVVNTPPVAVDDSYTVDEDGSVELLPLTGDSDADSDPLSIVSINGVALTPGTAQTIPVTNGTVTTDAAGMITFTPDADYNGPVMFPYVITDGTETATANQIITVDPVNDPPVAVDDTDTTPEDTPVTTSVVGNDTDTDGNIDPTSVTIVTPPTNGTVTVDPVTGDVTYTPNADFNGTDTYVYNVCDDGTPLPAQCDDATVTITVDPVNDAPVAMDDTDTTPEDTPVTTSVTGNDTDTDGNIDPTSVTIVTPPTNGTVMVDPVTGDVTYTPNADFTGTDTYTYNVCDDGTPLPAQCDDATVTITVDPVNDAPVAMDDTDTTPEDTPVTTSVVGNDTDTDGNIDPTSVTIVTPPTNGTVMVDPVTGDVTYTPNADFTGTDTYTYNVCDDGTPLPAQCDDATVTITVDPVNDAPVAVDDTDTTPEDTPVTTSVTGNDTDTDGNIDPTSVTIVTPPTNGTVTVDPVTGDVTYTPDPDFNGTDTYVYNVCDDGTPLPAQCDDATVTITVDPVNDAPVAMDDTDTTPEDTPVTTSVTGNDTDTDGNIDPTSVTIVTPPTNGTVTVDPVTGDVTYTPDPDFTGTDTYTYNVCDDGTPLPAQCDDATVTITVDPVNDPPVAVDDTDTTPEDTPVTTSVTGNDTDTDGNIDPTSVMVLSNPTNGVVSVDPTTGDITYTPNADFTGTDSYTYRVCDDGTPTPVACATATVTITVDPVNDAPVAMDDTDTTPEDTPVTTSVVGNDTDVDGNIDPTSVTIVTPPTNGTVMVDPVTGDVTYTPNASFSGMDTYTYNVCDDGTPLPAQCDDATVTITVDNVNGLPVAEDDAATVMEDMALNIDPLPNDDFGTDGPGVGPITITLTPSNGTATVNDGGTPDDPTDDTIDYTPNADYNGPDVIVYEICDADGECDNATINVTVSPVDDMPVAENDVAMATEDMSLNIDPLPNDDFGGDGPSTGAIAVTLQPANGTATVNDGGTPNDPTDDTIDYTPNADYNGPDVIVYQICDADGDCDDATITVDVAPVNDLPVAMDDLASATEDMPLNIDPLPNDDFGGDGPSTGTITIVTQPTDGTAVINDGGTPDDPTDDTIDFLPNPDYNGPDVIVYEICDSNGDCDQAMIDVTVAPVNDLPVAMDDVAAAMEDMALNIDPLVNDDFGGDGPSTGTISIVTPPTNGMATINDGGTPNDPTDDTIDYVPTADYNGPDVIVYEICDVDGDCDQATIDVMVAPVNDLPVAMDDLAAATEDMALNIDPLPNDDFGGDGPSTGTITIVTPPTNGMATINDGGTPSDPTDDTIDYVPTADYNGPDVIVYEICDADGDCDQATIDVTVAPVNDLPVAMDDVAAATEDMALNIDPLPNDDFGGDGPSMGTISIELAPSNGTATVNDGGTPNDPTDDTIDYTPNPDYNGPDVIVYQICDENGDCDDATITVDVAPVNDLPVAMDDVAAATEDMALNIDPLPNDDFGGDGPSMGTITIQLAPSNGTATVNDGGTPNDPTDDTIDYTPNPDYNGPDVIMYQICDENGDCDDATITVNVAPVNDLPVAEDDLASATEDMALNIDPLPNDDFGGDGPGTGPITIVTPPTNGTATINDGGTPSDPTDDTIDYVPTADYNGPDVIVYEICDSNGDCDQAMIDVTVAPVNDLPVVMDDVAAAMEDTPLNIDPLLNDDFGGDGPGTGTITIVTPPTNGVATINDGGTPDDPTDDTIDYVPTADYNGPDVIVYEICDSNGDCDQAMIDVAVAPVNDLPVAMDDVADATEDMALNIDPLLNDDFGGDGPSTGTITIVTPPTNGMATINDGGTPNDPTDDTIDYVPTADYNGPDVIVYEICDVDGECDQATIDVTVAPVNDLPVAENDLAMATEDSPLNIDPLPNDDFGGDGPSMGIITIELAPMNGTATINDGGTPNDPTDDTIDYVPNPDYNGPDAIVYQICDSNGDCDDATISIDVAPVNDLPVAEDDIVMVTEDTPENIDPLVNDDFGGDGPAVGSITIVLVPFNGMATVNDGGTPDDPTDDTIDYTPNPNYNGPDVIIYEICDVDGDCDQATASINVGPVNDIPVAEDDMITATEDTPLNIEPLVNDDFGGEGPGVGPITIVTPPTNGTATVNDGGTPDDPTDDTIDFEPNPDYNGPEVIVYEICDADGDCDQATIDLTVESVNDLPVAEDDMATATEDIPLNIDPLPNDDFGGDGPSTGTITIVTPPTNGTAVVNDGGTPDDPTDDTIDYTPNPDYNGPDVIVYQICDADGDCDDATIDVTVDPVNDLPEAMDDMATATEDMPLNFDPLPNDDFGGDGPSTGTITIVTPPTNGTAVVNDGGTPDDPTDDTIDYTPNPDYNGPDVIVYQICDADGDCDQATITVNVDAVNDLPVADNDSASTGSDSPVNIPVLVNDDFGGDGPSTGAITITSPPTTGTAVVNDGGTPNDPTDDTIDFTPDLNFEGTEMLTYQICDSNGDCDDAMVTITISSAFVKLNATVLLQGALLDATGGLMRDDLRSRGFIPTSEPYSALASFTHQGSGGTEVVADPATVFADYGANSIVDWVFVELRSSSSPETVVETRSGLVQRDGDIVDVDGVSSLCFLQSVPGDYFVAVRHRNHLGTMTANAITMTAAGTTVDFTNTNIELWTNELNFDGVEQITVDGRFALWAGNTSSDDGVIFAGQSNDKDPIFNEIDMAPTNVFRLQTFVLPGYNLNDVNLDGDSIFAGQRNDVDHIFNNVDGHPSNIFKIQTFIILEQLAE